MTKYVPLLFVGLLSACTVPQSLVDREVAIALESQDSALCEALDGPVDDLANTIVREQKNTPSDVITRGTVVIRGFDEGCS